MANQKLEDLVASPVGDSNKLATQFEVDSVSSSSQQNLTSSVNGLQSQINSIQQNMPGALPAQIEQALYAALNGQGSPSQSNPFVTQSQLGGGLAPTLQAALTNTAAASGQNRFVTGIQVLPVTFQVFSTTTAVDTLADPDTGDALINGISDPITSNTYYREHIDLVVSFEGNVSVLLPSVNGSTQTKTVRVFMTNSGRQLTVLGHLGTGAQLVTGTPIELTGKNVYTFISPRQTTLWFQS